jgi:acyl transferase domain-containing protein
MAAVQLSAAEAERAVADFAGAVTLAAINGPSSTVLSGELEPLGEIVAALDGRGVAWRWLDVEVAFHSAQMEGLQPALAASLQGISPRPATGVFVSTVTGEPIAGEELGTSYWTRNIREPVRFMPALRALVDAGCTDFLEIAPHPVLSRAIRQSLSAWGVSGLVLSSLRRDLGERTTLLRALGQLYASGRAVNWRGLFPRGGRRVPLPHYPWQRRRHWLELPSSPASATPPAKPAAEPSEGGPTISSQLVQPDAPPGGDESSVVAFLSRLRGSVVAERRSLIAERVVLAVARVLGFTSATEIERDRPFRELGLDSMMALELRDVLADSFGMSLPATLVFDCPTTAAVVEYLDRELFPPVLTPPITSQLATTDRMDSLVDDLLNYVERLSDDEVRTRLAQAQ